MGWNGVGWEGRVGWIEGKKSEGFVLVGIAISVRYEETRREEGSEGRKRRQAEQKQNAQVNGAQSLCLGLAAWSTRITYHHIQEGVHGKASTCTSISLIPFD